jgi:hypothetical protein
LVVLRRWRGNGPATITTGRWPAHQPRRITMSHEKLCPVHRGLIAMSGRVA